MKAEEHAKVWNRAAGVMIEHGLDMALTDKTRQGALELVLLCNAMSKAYSEISLDKEL